MALRSKALHHGRSLSLPSNIHPSISQFNDNLAKIQQASSDPTTSSSLSSMETRVNGLTNLYCDIDDLLMLPHIQHIISQQSQQNWVDQLLDAYIRLLDASTTAKDLFSHIKHNIQQLLSALRRKDLSGISSYQTSRNQSKKMIQKALKDLRSLRTKNNGSSLEKDDQETMALVCMLKEAESVTIATFECLLSYVMGTKKSGWSLVSKLLPSKKVSHQGEETDLNNLKEMESSIQILEEELECLFRQLIKTRVFLLNILNH